MAKTPAARTGAAVCTAPPSEVSDPPVAEAALLAALDVASESSDSMEEEAFSNASEAEVSAPATALSDSDMADAMTEDSEDSLAMEALVSEAMSETLVAALVRESMALPAASVAASTGPVVVGSCAATKAAERAMRMSLACMLMDFDVWWS